MTIYKDKCVDDATYQAVKRLIKSANNRLKSAEHLEESPLEENDIKKALQEIRDSDPELYLDSITGRQDWSWQN